MEDQLATLEVMGSKASQLLQRILHPVSVSSQHSSVLKKCSVAEDYSETRLKLTNFFENEDEVSSAAVLSLTVSDPRVLIEKGVANVPEAVKGHNSVCLEAEECSKLSDSMDLWGAPTCLCPPVEESVLCMEKHHQRLGFFRLGGHSSGEVNASTDGQFSRLCPILLLRSSNLKVSLLRCSIILPLSWVKAFWIPLISNGARAIGLREKHWIACEGGLPYFPSDFPDCNAYSSFMATKAAASDQDASRRPSCMRPLRVPIPPPWDSICFTLNKKSILLGDSQSHPGELCAENMVHDHPLTSSSSGVHDIPAVSGHGVPLRGIVARTPCMLVHFLHSISGDHLLLFPAVPDKKKCISKLMKDEVMLSQGSSRVISTVNNDKRLCFLRVLLHAFKDGVFEEGAVVCAPHPTDITLWTSGTDKNVELQITQSSLRSYFAQQLSGKWEVREPEDPKARESHRCPIGFVTSGFVRGSKRPVAGALCEAVSLACLREEQWKAVPAKKRREEIYVLVRNLKSTAYRLALASIALEHHKADMEYM
ncbi:hypothetical protein RJ639_033590 [Escallonia herrerae]|uniref:Uncharacterized protein n=1 Tax=Escallonia herrerae TaxID=1293975 RepID=A0AA89BAK5_9ASTE|nr:hypothetical protein RJ639_033590 [Escallonia herrerae]